MRTEIWARWLRTTTEIVACGFKVTWGLAKSLCKAIRRERVRRATIRELSGLSGHVLKDIGLSQSSIYSVANEVSDH